MGMHTVLAQGGGTLSGGQRQRLLIARALASQPTILFFDEATSALDNLTQAAVSESLEGLRVTRIVIAHRLSTIQQADKIVVLERGRVVEEGRFDDLMERQGVFYALAKRQTV
jgi:ABC-type bacteriocin/lantibiotic exporter with double-glycine peptidase domain